MSKGKREKGNTPNHCIAIFKNLAVSSTVPSWEENSVTQISVGVETLFCVRMIIKTCYPRFFIYKILLGSVNVKILFKKR
jgi:hypothetical protein